jgi:anti-sigma B factor antagonist
LPAEVRSRDGVAVVHIQGSFDAATAPALKAQLHALIGEGETRVVVNLAGLEFIDSAGLGVLVSCLRRAAADGGDLLLAEVPAFCRSVLHLTRLTRVFSVNETEDEAVEALTRTPGA